MKKRSDFVTNSSSSSFVLSLKFELANEKEITWRGMADAGEGGYKYIELSARKSPQELGSCDTINELVEMLKASVGEGLADYESDFTPIFTDNSPIIKSLKKTEIYGRNFKNHN